MADPVKRTPEKAGAWKAWCAGGAALLIVSAAYMKLIARREDPGEPRPFAIPAARPEVRADTAGTADRLFSGPKEREEESIDGLLDLLAKPASTAEGKQRSEEFRAEFMKEPKLKQAYESYAQRPPEERPSKRQFLAALRAMPEFRGLAVRLAGGGSSGAGDAPGALHAFPGAPRKGGSAAARDAAQKGIPGVQSIGRPRSVQSSGSMGGPASAGQRSAFSGTSSAGSVGAGTAGAPAGGAVSYSSPSPAASGGGPATLAKGGGEDQKDISTKLTKLDEAKSEQMARFCTLYSRLCEGDPPRVKAEFKTLFNSGLIETNHGIMGSCFLLKMFAVCNAVCGGNIPCQRGWDACMDGYSNAATCITECKQQPPCEVDALVWDKHCAAPTRQTPPQLPPAYCGTGAPTASAPAAAEEAPTGMPNTCMAGPDQTCCFGPYGTIVMTTNFGYQTRGSTGVSAQKCGGSDLQPAGTCRKIATGTECRGSDGTLLFQGGDGAPAATLKSGLCSGCSGSHHCECRCEPECGKGTCSGEDLSGEPGTCGPAGKMTKACDCWWTCFKCD